MPTSCSWAWTRPRDSGGPATLSRSATSSRGCRGSSSKTATQTLRCSPAENHTLSPPYPPTWWRRSAPAMPSPPATSTGIWRKTHQAPACVPGTNELPDAADRRGPGGAARGLRPGRRAGQVGRSRHHHQHRADHRRPPGGSRISGRPRLRRGPDPCGGRPLAPLPAGRLHPHRSPGRERLGLTWVKAFPAGWLGPQWFSLMKARSPA